METTTLAPVTSIPEAAPAPMVVIPEVSETTLAKQKAASWGAIIVIVLILGMIVIGAFYAWGQRVAQTPTEQPAS